MSLTSRDHLAEVESTKRRLEIRIGELLGPAEVGRPSAGNPDRGQDLNDRQKADFRQMAEHPEVVEEVIAESTDITPGRG